LQANVLGNPHSLNPTSAAASELVERARSAVLGFFRASPQEYVAIFTPNATGALRLVGEAYPFRPGDRFLLTFDNHNSVNGIREFARARGAETTYVPSVAPDLRVEEELLPRYLREVAGEHHNLFAYPAQSNFSGVQHPLAWIEQAQERGWTCCSMPPPTRPRTGSTSPVGTRTSSRSASRAEQQLSRRPLLGRRQRRGELSGEIARERSAIHLADENLALLDDSLADAKQPRSVGLSLQPWGGWQDPDLPVVSRADDLGMGL